MPAIGRTGTTAARWAAYGGVAILVVLAYRLSRADYLLFHGLAEGFSVMVATCVFAVAWSSRGLTHNGPPFLIGTTLLAVAVLDALHALAYKGMGVFPLPGADPATQLWLISRMVASLGILAAVALPLRAWPTWPTLAALLGIAALGAFSVLVWRVFPTAFEDGQGLTPFKVAVEFAVMGVSALAVLLLHLNRDRFDPELRRHLVTANLLMMAMGACFSFYADVYGGLNFTGHVLKVLAYLSLFRAVVETGIRRPQALAMAALDAERSAVAEAHRTLQAERDRARLYFDTAGVMLLVIGADRRVRDINSSGAEILGLPPERIIGRDWLDFVPPARRDDVRQLFAAIVERGADHHATSEGRVVRGDGMERIIAWRNSVLRDERGRVMATLSSGEDVTERRAAEQARELLSREVDHRAKNALAVVQSLVRLSRASTKEEFVAAVEGRVGALARAHSLLAEAGWSGSGLAVLAAEELEPYLGTPGQIFIGGPEIRLGPDAVQPVAMALHELATNAAKHGALSDPSGHVRLVWQLDAAGDLLLDWYEMGGPAVSPPTRAGFGSSLLAANVQGQLAGDLTLDWRPEGLHCRIRIPAVQFTAGPSVEPRGPHAPPGPSIRGARVLVAEDNAVLSLELEVILRELGCDVVGPVAGLEDALLAAEAPNLDLALLDMTLQGQPSHQVAARLRVRGVPVIYCTGLAELPASRIPDGALVLRKPFSAAQLADIAAAALKTRRAPATDQH